MLPDIDFEDAIVLIGGGGHCQSVLDCIMRGGLYRNAFVADPILPVGSMMDSAMVIGSDDALSEVRKLGISKVAVTIGSIESTIARKRAVCMAEVLGFEFPAIIDPSAVVSERAKVGRGVFIGKNAVVNANATVDDFAILNTGAIVEHGCCVGAFAHVSVGAVLCGEVEVCNDVFVGANATVIQGVRLGAGSLIGAGGVVIGDVPCNGRVVGVGGGAPQSG